MGAFLLGSVFGDAKPSGLARQKLSQRVSNSDGV